ncbi:unnamed protein product, partial [Vitis vinifera]
MKALKASLFLLALRCLTVASAAWHVDDESGLLAFKSAITHDPSGMLQDWKPGTDCCKWSGMDCLGENRVMTLSLTGQPGERDSFLFGTISPSLGKVQNLVGIYLLNLRNISGPFRIFFFRMSKPQYVYIEYNRLSGLIPRNIGNLARFSAMSLEGNRFTGPIPSSISQLTGTCPFSASIGTSSPPYNHFHLGAIPKWVTSSEIIYSPKLAKCGLKFKLDDWKPLETYFYDYIDLSENKIIGSPIRLLNKTDYLVGFWTPGNQLRFNMSKSRIVKTLNYIDMSRNMVFGKVPEAISGLEKLNVSHNHLCARIPPSKFPASAFQGNDCLMNCLTAASAACHVDDELGLLAFKSAITHDPSGMLQNWKSGTDCCKWPGITCLSGNRVTSLSLTGQPGKQNSFLSGTISPSLVKVQNLDGIYLQNLRNITGPFPALLFGMPKLLFVYIENNQLSGPLRRDIGNLTQLNALSFEGNRFSGPIPSSISQLTGRLKDLTFLSLERNGLSGSIPDFFSSFSNLRILRLSHNKFSGKIPNSISSLSPKLAYLEVGHNSLVGQIPDFLGNFTALDTLDLSWNQFSGTVPKTFAKLTKIFNLDLSHNFLVDPFPEMSVKGIESLDLSYNHFHLGTIPKWVTSSEIIYSLKLAKCGLKFKLDDWKPSETYFYDYIDLSENEITGSPTQLLNKTDYLVGFWASGNQLRFDFSKLRIVKTLKYLDVSRSMVFGKVPEGITGLEKLNVSHNHLCGRLPPSKFPASAFQGNDCLCGSPLSACKRILKPSEMLCCLFVAVML